MLRSRVSTACVAVAAAFVLSAVDPGASARDAAAAPSDLDALMQRVLARRDENWKKLQQYILEEGERIDIHGPSSIPIWGERRDYAWFMRDGFFIRSPLRVNGVAISEDERRKAEDDYLKHAKDREAQRAGRGGRGRATDSPDPNAPPPAGDLETVLRQSRQPEFIDSAYFLRFRFEQGRYALVGRERFNDLDVLRIEYYPARLFSHEQDKQTRQVGQGRDTRDQDFSAAIERMMNKVSLVTLWIEPQAAQIVKYTFDNVNFDFLPGAWLFRVNDAKASMTMSQPFTDKKDVWLPRDVDMYFAAMFAIGQVDVRYHLDYKDYKEASATMRIKKTGGR